MIGHVALFGATFVGAAALSLGFPSGTGSDVCLARIVSFQDAAKPSTNVHAQGVAESPAGRSLQRSSRHALHC
jgi:hypothetical protein